MVTDSPQVPEKETLPGPTSALYMMANIVENIQFTDTIPGA